MIIPKTLSFFYLPLAALLIFWLPSACYDSHKPDDGGDSGLSEEGGADSANGANHLVPEREPAGLSNVSFSLDKTYRVGDTMAIDVIVDNTSSSTIEGTLDVTIGIDDIYSMLFPDEELPVGSIPITVSPRSKKKYSFTYTLPVDISDANGYYVIASIKYANSDLGEDRSMQGFEVVAFYHADLTIPTDLHVCESNRDCSFEIGLVIENNSSKLITGLSCELELSYGVQTLDGGKHLVLVQDELQPYETITKTAELKVVAANEASRFHVVISSDNGGRTEVSKGVEIAPVGP